jgi:hypothetical protein
LLRLQGPDKVAKAATGCSRCADMDALRFDFQELLEDLESQLQDAHEVPVPAN